MPKRLVFQPCRSYWRPYGYRLVCADGLALFTPRWAYGRLRSADGAEVTAMNLIDVFAAVVAGLLLIYLVYALIKAEDF
jgi:K+-transporting ATPase KdpF subunit